MARIKLIGWILLVPFIFVMVASYIIEFFGDKNLFFTDPNSDVIVEFSSLESIILAFLFACVAAPLIEEMIFRGSALWLARHTNPSVVKVHVVFSSLIWACLHEHGLWLSLAFFLTGLLYSWACLKTRSVSTTIFAHAIWNFMFFILALIAFYA